MLSTFRFFLLGFRVVAIAGSFPTTLALPPASGSESFKFRSAPEVTWPEPEPEVVSAAALSKAVASAMMGGGDVAFFINGDRSLFAGVHVKVAPSASPRSLSELTSQLPPWNTYVKDVKDYACEFNVKVDVKKVTSDTSLTMQSFALKTRHKIMQQKNTKLTR